MVSSPRRMRNLVGEIRPVALRGGCSRRKEKALFRYSPPRAAADMPLPVYGQHENLGATIAQVP
jgi:hypothetical protein